MKVNINDIEDIIVAKIQIDKDNPAIEGKSPLNEFINNYCQINWLLMYNDISIPFEIKTIFDKTYILFSSDSKNEQNLLFEFIDKIQANISNLKKLNSDSILENGLKNNTLYIIMNNNYFTL